jgi:hypothetical protein
MRWRDHRDSTAASNDDPGLVQESLLEPWPAAAGGHVKGPGVTFRYPGGAAARKLDGLRWHGP